MPLVVIQVDRTSVNYEQVFVYTINASFNGIAGAISSAKIKVFFPNEIYFMPGSIEEPIKGVTEEVVEGGKNIIFDFGAIEDLGIAIRIGIGARYKLEALADMTYIAQPELWINNELSTSSTAETVVLRIVGRFELRRQMVLPAIEPAPGGAVYYQVTLENFGDKGAIINNMNIVIPAVEGVTIDSTFVPIGEDQSEELFKDESQDGVIGTIIDNSLSFNITSYRGSKYQFLYKVFVGADIGVGSEIVTQANWWIDNVVQQQDVMVINLGEPIYSALIEKYGPDYTLPDEYINYELKLINNGNQQLENVYIVDELPNSIQYYEVQTGTFYIEALNKQLTGEYFIEYTTVNGAEGTLGPFVANVNQIIDLTEIIEVGDNLATLSWGIQTLQIGSKQLVPPQINGRVKLNLGIGTTLMNHYHLEWQTPNGTRNVFDNHTCIIQNLCILKPKFRQISPNRPVKPLDIIRYSVGIDCNRSRLSNPIIAMLLPEKLDYIGNVTSQYTDYFNKEAPPSLPPIRIVKNFKGTGRTLVKFTFDGAYSYDFSQRAALTFAFDTQVKIGAIGSIEVAMLLNTKNSIGIVPRGFDVFVDSINIAEDAQVSNNYAMSQPIMNQILFFVSAKCDKKVKGVLDSEFIEEPLVGTTTKGGSLTYQLEIMNTGNANLKNIEIVDILPHVSDRGVVEVDSPRLSAYKVYNTNEITAMLLPVKEGQTTPQIEVFYSGSYDPHRFGRAFQMIGTINDWTQVFPQNATDVKAIKIKLQNTEIYPGQTLKVLIQGVVPNDALANTVAWNSFAASVSYSDLNGDLQRLLAIEPEKVGIKVMPLAPNKGEIGGVVWIDEEKDGIYNPTEQGIDDVGVVLFNEQGYAIQAVFTTSNTIGEKGRYLFSNLEKGKYYLGFFIDTTKYEFTRQRLDVEGGSKVNPLSGMTRAIDLNTQSIQNTINAGIVLIDTMKYMLEINNSARRMIRNVVYNQMLIAMKYEDIQQFIK